MSSISCKLLVRKQTGRTRALANPAPAKGFAPLPRLFGPLVEMRCISTIRPVASRRVQATPFAFGREITDRTPIPAPARVFDLDPRPRVRPP